MLHTTPPPPLAPLPSPIRSDFRVRAYRSSRLSEAEEPARRFNIPARNLTQMRGSKCGIYGVYRGRNLFVKLTALLSLARAFLLKVGIYEAEIIDRTRARTRTPPAGAAGINLRIWQMKFNAGSPTTRLR